MGKCSFMENKIEPGRNNDMGFEGSEMHLSLGGVDVYLLSERAMFLPRDRTMVIGDLHFGKVNHFRRAGLPVPLAANQRNAERLIDLLNAWKPERVLFLGDLFHSTYNDDWEVVGQIVKHFSGSLFELIRGNHDILSDRQYPRHGISVSHHVLIHHLLLTHEPMERSTIPAGQMNIAGHIHPAARLVGKGRQSITMPCFWLSENQLILPAFGSFTGLAVIRPQVHDTVYAIAEGRLIKLRPTDEHSGAQPKAS